MRFGEFVPKYGYNFQDIFPVRKISDFEFGSADAFKDDVLNSETFCFTNAAKSSMDNKRNLIIGPPGSGKSAIFKAYEDKILLPKDYGKRKFILVGISDELEYLDIDDIIDKKFNSYKYPEDEKYVLLWDMFIVFKLLLKMNDDFGQPFRKEIEKISELFGRLELSKKSTFKEFLEKVKEGSLGIKGKYGGLVLSLKTGFEGSNTKTENNIIDLTSIKNKINDILKSENAFAWIMIDKIDDFVLGKDYEIQKKLLRSLIRCWLRFSDYPRVHLKIFIRDDLLNRLAPDIEQSDKIDDRVVRIIWSSKEIRRFMAKRLVHNYITILHWDIEAFVRDEMEDKELEDDIWEAREVSFKEKICNKMITMVFPKNKREIDINAFFDTHLSFSRKKFSPRVMRRFLEISFEKASEYYCDNPIGLANVKIDNNGEYPLIKKRCMFDAYVSIVNKAEKWTLNKGSQHDLQWVNYLTTYFNSINKEPIFELEEFCYKLKCDIEYSRILLAFLENVGAIRCIKSDRVNWIDSEYEIPLFFRSYTYHRQWGL